MKATIITVGDEILIGQVIDTNSAWLGGELNQLGVDVVEILSVSDKAVAITDALDRAFGISDVIIMTGGLGPTKDDITKKTIADYFGVEMYFDEATHDKIKALFERFGRTMTDMHKVQCYMPKNATLLNNDMGTAPGMMFAKGEKLLFSMPGVPFEMKYIFENGIKAVLHARNEGKSFVFHKTIMTSGIGESFIAEKVEHISDGFPEGLSLAYLPSLGSVRLRITGKGTRPGIKDDVLRYAGIIEKEISKYVYGYDNEALESAVKRHFDKLGWTLATAESCTGGYLSHKLTSIPGSSSYFQGGVVSYSNELKMKLLGVKKETLENHGAVSEQTVIEMANGAKKLNGASVGIGISGIAGPDGGTPDKPVGTIWYAIALPDDTTNAYLLKATKDRGKNIEYTATMVMSRLLSLI